MMRVIKLFVVLLLSALLLQSCYYRHPSTFNAEGDSGVSARFLEEHHFAEGFNFVVFDDSLPLCAEIPSRAKQLAIMPDSLWVFHGDELIVAQMETDSCDEVDSVWIKVARDQDTQGWVHESVLLRSVSPDDPISKTIYYFSGNHVWATFALVGILCIVVLLHLCFTSTRRLFPFYKLQIVCSPYPFLLCLSMSCSAVFYASMQLFAPQAWADYYFHPTLNPFAVTPLLGAFLISFWLIVLFFIATVDESFRQLKFTHACLYMLFVTTLLALLYLLFSFTTLVYLGYILGLLFVAFWVWLYIKKAHPRYRCGKCGRPLHDKGVCPRCGSINL